MTITAQIIPILPAAVEDGPGIDLAVTNGVLTAGLDYSTLPEGGDIVDYPDYQVAAQNPATGEIVALELGNISGMQPDVYDPQEIEADAFARANHTGEQAISTITGLSAALVAGRREMLLANRTYYVRQDGNDSNTGLTNTSGGAFATLNRARDAVYSIDLNGKSITIQLQVSGIPYAGTQWDGPIPGASTPTPVTIQGDGSNVGGVIVLGSSTNSFRARGGARLFVQGLEVRATGTGVACIATAAGGEITYDNIRFGLSQGPHKEVGYGGSIIFSGGVGYFITGDAVSHQHVTNGGYMLNLSGTGTLIGTPNFSSYFYGSALSGVGQFVAFSYIGSPATGQRFFIWKNSICDTGAAADPNFFPGDVAGAVSEGGRYV